MNKMKEFFNTIFKGKRCYINVNYDTTEMFRSRKGIGKNVGDTIIYQGHIYSIIGKAGGFRGSLLVE
jgi:hypothetical protein